jgi:hypothetical protein
MARPDVWEVMGGAFALRAFARARDGHNGARPPKTSQRFFFLVGGEIGPRGQ